MSNKSSWCSIALSSTTVSSADRFVELARIRAARAFLDSAAALVAVSLVSAAAGVSTANTLSPAFAVSSDPWIAVAAAAQSLVGVLGLLISTGVLVSGVYHATFARIVLRTQALLSALSLAPLCARLSADRAAGVLQRAGLLAAQLLLLARMAAAARGRPPNAHAQRARAAFCLLILALTGACILLTATNAVPTVAGACMLGWGITGGVIAAAGAVGLVRYYVPASCVVYIIALGNATVGVDPGAEAGLAFVVVFMGPFFLQKFTDETDMDRVAAEEVDRACAERGFDIGEEGEVRFPGVEKECV